MQLALFHVAIIVLAIVAVIGFELFVNGFLREVIERNFLTSKPNQQHRSSGAGVTPSPRWSQGCYLSGRTKPTTDFRHLIES